MSSYNYILFVLLLAAGYYSNLVCAQGNFSLSSGSYNCTTDLICLGAAHVGESDGNTTFAGRLSLLWEEPEHSRRYPAIAYYKEPVRMLDPATRQSASFNTNFVVDTVMKEYNDSIHRLTGDGITFVISANKSALGADGSFLGIFDAQGRTDFKSIVVEFDTYKNEEPPMYDISHNHVSFDFQSITAVAAANASDVNILLWYNQTFYAWVEYSSETQQLELRISYSQSRPVRPLLNYTVDLFNVVDEYMWVGFSSASGDNWNHYYIGDWKFESYGIPVAPPAKSSKLGIILGISVGVPILLAIASAGIFAVFYVRRKRRLRSTSSGSLRKTDDRTLSLPGIPEKFRYKDLSVATGGFSEKSKLGEGGYGSVYSGVLPKSGTQVAVKKIRGDSNQGEKEFMAEISIISQLRHRNLMHLLGWCKDTGKYLLVYELMPNGSLDKVLFLPEDLKHTALTWKQRFNILLGTASALDYLHQGWQQQVIHRDIKASNIMLDSEWNAKLGDFGLARLVDHLMTAPTTVVAGTYGYIAPEAASGKFTDKTDVFAFGAVALEIACGRKAFDIQGPPCEIVLLDWVWESLSEGKLLRVVDKRLSEYDTYWMEVVLLTGLLCSHPDPAARPSMRNVVQVLAGEAPVPSVPLSKPATAFKSDSPNLSIQDLHLAKPKAAPKLLRSPSGSSTSTSTSPQSGLHGVD